MSWTRFGSAAAWEIARLLSAHQLPQPPVETEADFLARCKELFPHATVRSV